MKKRNPIEKYKQAFTKEKPKNKQVSEEMLNLIRYRRNAN